MHVVFKKNFLGCSNHQARFLNECILGGYYVWICSQDTENMKLTQNLFEYTFCRMVAWEDYNINVAASCCNCKEIEVSQDRV